jgi:hypothetical protein
MPAKDIYHETVKAALIKDGWTITDDPLNLKIGTRNTAIFKEEAGELLLEKPGFCLVVFDENTEEIPQWKPPIDQ